MKGRAYTLGYAAVLGMVCGLVLTGVGKFTEPYREANAQAEKVRNILAVLKVPFKPDSLAKELLETYQRNVRVEKRGSVTLYIFSGEEPGAQARALAVPFVGQGAWGTIKGILALEPDMKTIRGITFYEQEETPGLGGEITSTRFRDQFKGKFLEDVHGKPGIRILRGGGASGPNEVDAITGATITSTKVEAMLNTVIEQIAKEFWRK